MRIPKRGPTFDQIVREPLTPDFIQLGAKASVRELIARANLEYWNYESCDYHAHQAGLTAEQFWAFIKFSRWTDRQSIPLKDRTGKPFTFRLTPSAQRILHEIDLHLGGTIEGAFPQIDTPESRARFIVTSLTEEAITSSQIEGAAVTREDAQRMLREKRPPKTTGEWMVLNNYRTIRKLNQERQQPVTIPRLLEIQSSLTENAIENPDARGRFRQADEDITVWDEQDQKALHHPPPASELPRRIQTMCDFANESSSSAESFVHPAIRAIILHFWTGYDHPFVDGNGRTARALFYWSMLHSGYWLIEYLTISSIIRGQTRTYAQAFLDSEVDENDLTYFIVYHLDVIERSLREFRAYLDRKTKERRQLASVLLPARFNPRQQELLGQVLRDPAARFTYAGHSATHAVTLMTARTDLLDLESEGLLRGNRAGRRYEFVAAPDFADRLRRMARKN